MQICIAQPQRIIATHAVKTLNDQSSSVPNSGGRHVVPRLGARAAKCVTAGAARRVDDESEAVLESARAWLQQQTHRVDHVAHTLKLAGA